MSEKIKVANKNEVTSGQRKLVKVNNQEIALFNIEGEFYAINNSCPHSTGPLVEGRLAETTIICPWHGAQFDVTTGEYCGGPALTNVETYPVHVEDGVIFVEIT